MLLRFPLLVISSLALSVASVSAFAKDTTIAFGDVITLEEGHSYIEADALNICAALDKEISARIEELGIKLPALNTGAYLSVTTKIERRALQKGPRRPTQIQYFCSANIRSTTPKLVLHHGQFKEKQDEACDGTFTRLSSERSMIFERTFERKTLFKHRHVCKANYVEVLQR